MMWYENRHMKSQMLEWEQEAFTAKSIFFLFALSLYE